MAEFRHCQTIRRLGQEISEQVQCPETLMGARFDDLETALKKQSGHPGIQDDRHGQSQSL